MTTNQDFSKATNLLDAKAVAERLNVSVRSVRRLIANGEITVIRIGRAVRISEADLARIIHGGSGIRRWA